MVVTCAGGLFELVSCPHYLAEMIIYVPFTILQGRNGILPWLILTWVVGTLTLRFCST